MEDLQAGALPDLRAFHGWTSEQQFVLLAGNQDYRSIKVDRPFWGTESQQGNVKEHIQPTDWRRGADRVEAKSKKTC